MPKKVDIRQAWRSVFDLDTKALAIMSYDPVDVPKLGLIIRLSLYDPKTYQGPSGEVTLAASGEDPGQHLKRIKGLVAKLKKDPKAAKKALSQSVAETFGLPPVLLKKDTFVPSKDDTKRRTAALAASMKRFDAVAKHFAKIYGLRLPRHIAVWDAFEKSLSEIEKRGLGQLGRSRSGIMVLFEDDGLKRKTRDKLDPRLESRFRGDPPELVTVMHGDSDGLHYGLFYDDPAALPSFIAYNYARDSAETWRGEVTVLREIAKQVAERMEDGDEEPTIALHALGAALAAFRAADAKALKGDGTRKWEKADHANIMGGIAPALPKTAGGARGKPEARMEAYRARSPKVAQFIKDAKSELAKGKPGYALILGRELHWLDADDYRKESLELMTFAYEKLGRGALADIARVHHANRDLQTVDVYEIE